MQRRGRTENYAERRSRSRSEPSSTPIFTAELTRGKKTEIQHHVETEPQKEFCVNKTRLIKAQLQLYRDGHYEKMAARLKNVNTYEGLIEAFSEHPHIVRLISRLRGHEEWLYKDTTWGWMSHFFYVAPPAILRRMFPILFREGSYYEYHCGVCAKGGNVPYAQHIASKIHMEHQLRWINMYGNTCPVEVDPVRKRPHGKRYLMDLEEEKARKDVPITIEPMKDGSIPDGFEDKYEVTRRKGGYVCFTLHLSKKEATSVKVTSSDIRLGAKFTGEWNSTKKASAYEFFPMAPQKKDTGRNYKVVTWRTLAIPFDKSGWVDIRIDDQIFHQEYINKPEVGMVAQYVLDGSPYFTSNGWVSPRKSMTANCKRLSPDMPLDKFLHSTYRLLKPGQPWPVQVAGPEGFLLSAIVYFSDKKSSSYSKKGYNNHYNYSKDWQEYPPTTGHASSSSGHKNWNQNDNSWNSHDVWRDAASNDMDTSWSSLRGGGTSTSNNWWEDIKKGSQDEKKDILMYLHGDQYREAPYCLMPGIPTFAWPKPDSGPIKFAMEKPEEEIMHGKVILHPICLTDMYWMRSPNIHDASTFVPQMPQTLAKLKQIAANYWGGNEERFFLSGLSMGGYGALELAAYWGPKIIKGALFACPSHDASRQASWFAPRLREIPMWIFHSRTDTLCKWEETTSLVVRMRDMKAKELRFSSSGSTDFDCHSDTGYCFEYPPAFNWLFALE